MKISSSIREACLNWVHRKKMCRCFPVYRRDVTYQTVYGREYNFCKHGDKLPLILCWFPSKYCCQFSFCFYKVSFPHFSFEFMFLLLNLFTDCDLIPVRWYFSRILTVMWIVDWVDCGWRVIFPYNWFVWLIDWFLSQ